MSSIIQGRTIQSKRILCIFFPQALSHNKLINFRSLYKLARVCQELTPLVGMDLDLVRAYKQQSLNTCHPLYYGLVLDVTGTERVHHGEEALCQRITRALEKRSIPCRLAIAPTIGAAWALSRFAINQTTIIRTASLRDALSELPIAALRIHPTTTGALEELGILKIAQLLKFPTKTLGGRFGIEPLRRVHQALGTVDESFIAIPPPSPFSVTRVFEIPLTNNLSIQAITFELFSKLCTNLEKRGRKARSFVIIFCGEKNTTAREVSLNTATRTMKHLHSVISPVIERLSLREPIKKISVNARSVEKYIHAQHDFITKRANEITKEAADQAINGMVIRLGSEHVCESIIHESYVAEHAYSYVPVRPNHTDKASAPKPIPLALKLLDRPPFIFSMPEKASVIALLPDRPPARITWRGKEYKVITGIGPDRVGPEWWRKENRSEDRDYFKIQDDIGRWLWVYRNQKTHEWWVQGVWG